MRRRNMWPRIGLAMSAGVVLSSWTFVARAQEEPPCPAASTTIVQGSVGANQQSAPHPIDLLPCEQVVVEMTGSASSHPSGNANMKMTIRNAAGQTLAVNNFLCGSSCATSVPLPNTYPGYPLPGTRGVEGLAKDVIVYAGVFNWFGQPPATYTLTIVKQPRPAYNRGGPSFVEAPLIERGVMYYGSVHPLEPGQYYKIHLDAAESIHARGRMRGTSHGSNFTIRIYDAAFVEKKLMINTLAAANWVSFPAAGANPGGYTYTNTGAAGDFYLKLRANAYTTKDFEFFVTKDPKLTLFLDHDNPRNFNPGSPDSDVDKFVPGTNPATGLSRPVPATGTPIETVVAIAAYTVDNGSVVPPPAGVTEALFQLSDVSAFAGVAMNFGSITSPDFGLVSVSGVIEFATDHTARVDLEVHDYGGRAIVRAQAGPGPSVATMNLPKDTVGNNWVPDVGWKATANQQIIGTVADGGQPHGVDDDPAPPGDGTPGDGLSFFEEYRGFVVRNEHRRTDPAVKDLFIDSDLATDIGYAINLPVTKHWVFASQLAAGWEVNFNTANPGYGGPAPGHVPQNGLRVRQRTYAGATVYGETECSVTAPCTPNQVVRMEVYVGAIREVTPPDPSQTTINNPPDDAAIMETTGHEIGHGIRIDDYPFGTGPRLTVMVSGFLSWINSSWTNIPTTYDGTDRAQIRIH